MAQIYKINTAIDVVYGAVGAKIGLSDLVLIATNPSGNDQTPITMVEIDNGLYKAAFTPNVVGRWRIRVTSITASENGASAYYWVGNNSTIEGQLFLLTDTAGHIANITANGRLKVSQEPPTPPSGMTAVIKTEYGNVIGRDDNVYVIPNGETLVLQRLNGGGEQAKDGSVIELWYDPNGDTTGMTIIDVIFCNGVSNQHDLNTAYVGNGIRAIRMRRQRLSGGSRRLFSRWEGYY